MFTAIAALALPAGASAQSCGRDCLQQALDRFLTAMVAHDPGAADLGPAFRYTENALEVKAGEGLWKTATRLGAVQRRYLDPASGQAAYFGLIEEGAQSGIATLRIKVSGQRVTEGELVIGRADNGIFDGPRLVAAPPASGVLAPAKRTPRADMIRAANSYFDGLEAKKGDAIAAIPGCSRIENGVMMTGTRAGRGGAPPVDRGDCANMSAMGQISTVVNRRFPVVDEEAGVVVGMAVFNRPPGAARANGTLWPRNLLTEIFAIENGRIATIHAAMHYLEPDVPTAPGW
jgi:hypothetical protein